MLNRGVHDRAGIAVGGGQDAVFVPCRLGTTNVANNLEVRLPFKEALPDGAGKPRRSRALKASQPERAVQCAPSRVAWLSWVYSDT